MQGPLCRHQMLPQLQQSQENGSHADLPNHRGSEGILKLVAERGQVDVEEEGLERVAGIQSQEEKQAREKRRRTRR